MSVSACVPSVGISALAAESADTAATEAAVEEAAQDEIASSEHAETPDPTAPEIPEDAAPAAEEDNREDAAIESGEEETSAPAEDISDGSTSLEIAEEAAVPEDAADPSDETAPVTELETDPIMESEDAPVAENAPAPIAEPESDPAKEDVVTSEESVDEEAVVRPAANANAPTEEAYANASAFFVGESKTVSLSSDVPYSVLAFTPAESGYYKFYSESDYDTYGEIYNSGHSRLYSDDDSGDNSNFSLEEYLFSGNTYYLAARFFSTGRDGSITVHLEKGESSDVEFIVEGQDSTQEVYTTPNTPVTLKITAYSTTELTYTWRDEAGSIVGENASSYTFTPDRNATYNCTVSNGSDTRSIYYNITVDSHLKVSPEGAENGSSYAYLEASPNRPLTLKVIASADEGTTLSYSWEKNYNTIEDAADAGSYTIPAVTEEAEYSCTVKDQYGNSETVYFNVTVNTHLTAYAEGEDESRYSYPEVSPNSPLTLKVVASADEGTVLTYSWQKNYSTIEGETSDSYTIPAVTESATYSCTVRDQYENSETVYFYVSVNSHLTARAEGARDGYRDAYPEVSPNSPLTLKVIASADEGTELTYSWQKNYNTIEGETSDSYALEAATESATYSCTVRDQFRNTVTVYFYVSINSHLIAYPEGGRADYSSITISVAPHDSTTLRVIHSVDEGVPLTFTWEKGYTTIDGANADSYTLNDITSADTYRCVVKDSYGNSKTVTFYIRVENNLVVFPDGNPNPAGYSTYLDVPYGGSETLYAITSADDMTNLTFDWYCDNRRIADASTDHYELNNVERTAEYRCTVSDPYGNTDDVYFYVRVINHLNAYPEGGDEDDDYISLRVAPNSSLTLHAIVTADDTSDLTYSWDSNLDEIDSTTEYCETGLITQSDYYSCKISDKYGNEDEVSFYVTVDNDLQIVQENNIAVYNTRHTIYAEPGQTVDLNIVSTNAAVDPEGLTLQWYKGYEWLEGETSPSYTATVDKTTTYRCVVEDSFGNTAGSYFNIVVGNLFRAYIGGYNSYSTSVSIDRSIAIGKELKASVATYDITDSADIYPEGADQYSDGTHESSVSVLSDPTREKVTLKVIVDGDTTGAPLTYTWTNENNGQPIDSTSNTIQVDKVDGEYKCTVSDAIGTRRVVSFFVSGEWFEVYPDSDKQYWNKNVILTKGDTCTLAPVIEGTYASDDLTYMWFLNDRLIPGEEDPTLTITPEYYGEYTCLVRGKGMAYRYTVYRVYTSTFTGESITSGVSLNSYNTAGKYYSLDVAPGTSVELKNRVSNSLGGPLSYEWYKNDVLVSTAESLTITPDRYALYYCNITDQYNNQYQIAYYVYVNNFSVSAVKRNVSYNPETADSCTLQVSASADRTDKLTYTWTDLANDNIIANGTSDSIVVNPASSTSYRCKVSDGYGNSTSIRFNVSVVSGMAVKPVGWQSGQYNEENNLLTVITTKGTNVLLDTEYTLDGNSGLAYKWESHDLKTLTSASDDWTCIDSYEKALSITFDKDTRYVCIATDRYGNATRVAFDVVAGVDIPDSDVTVNKLVYNGKAQSPFTIEHAGTTLAEGTDYEVSQKPVDGGSYTVTIQFLGKYSVTADKTMDVTVAKAAHSITATAGKSPLAVGKTTSITVKGAVGAITYSSNNTGIATVDKTGKVTAKKTGTVTITAKAAGDKNYNAASKAVTLKVVPAATSSFKADNAVKGIKLTWKKFAGATQYVIERQIGSGSWKTLKTVGNVAAYSDTGANTNGTKYSYRITAKSAEGKSYLNKSVVCYKVARPAVKSAVNTASKKVTVKWAKNAKASGYKIQYGLKSSFSGAKTVTVTKNSTVSKVLTGLLKGKKYYVRILTYKKVGSKTYNSAWSAAKTVVIKK